MLCYLFLYLTVLAGDGQLEIIPTDVLSIRLLIRVDGKDYSITSNWTGGTSIVRFHSTIHHPVGNISDDESIRISFDLKGILPNGKEKLLGHASHITTQVEHAVTKVVSFNDIVNGVKLDSITCRLTVTSFYYKFPLDLTNEKLINEGNIPLQTSNPSRNSKEYNFLLSRRLHWTKQVPSSFNSIVEKQLDNDVSMYLKDLARNLKNQKAVLKRSIIKDKEMNRVGEKPYVATFSNTNRELMRTAMSPSKGVSSVRVSVAKPTRSAATQCRKTSYGVGYVGVVWPNTNDVTLKQEKLLYKLRLAEEKRVQLVAKIQQRHSEKQRKEAVKYRNKLLSGAQNRSGGTSEQEVATKQALKLEKELKNKQRQVKDLNEELVNYNLKRTNIDKAPSKQRPRSAPTRSSLGYAKAISNTNKVTSSDTAYSNSKLSPQNTPSKIIIALPPKPPKHPKSASPIVSKSPSMRAAPKSPSPHKFNSISTSKRSGPKSPSVPYLQHIESVSDDASVDTALLVSRIQDILKKELEKAKSQEQTLEHIKSAKDDVISMIQSSSNDSAVSASIPTSAVKSEKAVDSSKSHIDDALKSMEQLENLMKNLDSKLVSPTSSDKSSRGTSSATNSAKSPQLKRQTS